MKLSIVIPCYNEQDNVDIIYNSIKENCKKIGDYEMLFVNDGSKDKTLNNLKDIHKKAKENVKIINFSRNFGKEAAMYAGLKEAIGDKVVIIDADMQQNPKLIVEMYEFLEENPDFDCVAMKVKNRKENKLLKIFKFSFYKLIDKISDTSFVSGASDFRMFNRNMVNATLELSETLRFSKGIFSWVGFNVYYKEYEVGKRATGTTKWSFTQLFKYALNGIFAFTTAPLKIATFIGTLTSVAAVTYMLIVIIQKIFFGIDVPGYPTIISLVAFLGGIQLFCLGILGEYIGRSYIEVKNRPIYIAKEILDSGDKS